MMTKIFCISLLICSVSALTYSQISENSLTTSESKDSVRLKQNHLFDNARGNVANIFSNYNEYRNVKPVSLGTEISGVFYFRDNPMIEIYGVSLAIYPRHSNSLHRRPPGYGVPFHLNNTYFNNTMEYNSSDGYTYIAPGISVFSKNRKLSLDIYHKLSTPIIIDGIQQIMPYKVTLHF